MASADIATLRKRLESEILYTSGGEASDLPEMALAALDYYSASLRYAETQAARLLGGIEEAARIAENRHKFWIDGHDHGVCDDLTACADIAQAIRGISKGASLKKEEDNG